MHLLAALFFIALLLGLAVLAHHLVRDNAAKILAALRCEAPPRRAVRAAVRARPSVPRSRPRTAAA
jgi:hypothetical protein